MRPSQHRAGTATTVRLFLSLAMIVVSSSVTTTGAAWTNWNNGQRIGSFYAVAGTTNETVAVGIDGLIATRNNRTGTWTTQVFPGDPDFRAILYANHQYVVVREHGAIMTSPDGITWTDHESPTSKNLLGVFWDGHQYLAGGDGGTMLSSPDGSHWTSRESGCRINFYSFSYSGSRYVAVGNDGIRISNDSVTWSNPDQAPTSVPFTACTWSGSGFLACGLGLEKQPTIYTSPDGRKWTLRNSRIRESLRAALTVSGVLYIAGGSLVAKSTDGGASWVMLYPPPKGLWASLPDWLVEAVPGTATRSRSRASALFMGLADNGQDVIAAGFNHNVWAFPRR